MKLPAFVSKVKITAQGQVTIPTEARKDLKIDVGHEIYWYEHEGLLIASPELLRQDEVLARMKKGGKR